MYVCVGWSLETGAWRCGAGSVGLGIGGTGCDGCRRKRFEERFDRGIT